MSKLDTLLEQFDDLDRQTFNYNRDYAEVMRQIDELSFIGEIDKNDYYLSLLEQIFVKDPEDGNWDLITLTDEQREEFYLNGSISAYPDGFRIASSLHIYLNSKEKYVQIFASKGIIEEFGDPKDDYGKVYTEYNKNQAQRQAERAEFRIPELKDDDQGKIVLTKLLKVFERSKSNTINVHDFDLKIKQDMSECWGNLQHNKRLIDKEYQETNRPEIITMKQIEDYKYKKYEVLADYDLKHTLLGPGFDEIDYDNNGLTKNFNTLFEAESYFYSIIDFINKGNIKPEVHPLNSPQHIDFVEKHYLSDKWPMARDEAESARLEEELTKYVVSVTRFHDEIALKLEVWEMGIVYIVTNIWDRRSIN